MREKTNLSRKNRENRKRFPVRLDTIGINQSKQIRFEPRGIVFQQRQLRRGGGHETRIIIPRINSRKLTHEEKVHELTRWSDTSLI